MLTPHDLLTQAVTHLATEADWFFDPAFSAMARNRDTGDLFSRKAALTGDIARDSRLQVTGYMALWWAQEELGADDGTYWRAIEFLDQVAKELYGCYDVPCFEYRRDGQPVSRVEYKRLAPHVQGISTVIIDGLDWVEERYGYAGLMACYQGAMGLAKRT